MQEDYIRDEVVLKGRPFEDVIEKLQQVWEDAIKFAESEHEDGSYELGDLLEYTGYRMYLLGVEDGMKEDTE